MEKGEVRMGDGRWGNAMCGSVLRVDIRMASETSHSIWVKPMITIVYFPHKPIISLCLLYIQEDFCPS